MGSSCNNLITFHRLSLFSCCLLFLIIVIGTAGAKGSRYRLFDDLSQEQYEQGYNSVEDDLSKPTKTSSDPTSPSTFRPVLNDGSVIYHRIKSILTTLRIPADFTDNGNPAVDWLKKDHGFKIQSLIRVDQARPNEAQEEALAYYVYFLLHAMRDFKLHLGSYQTTEQWLQNAPNYFGRALKEAVDYLLESFDDLGSYKEQRWQQVYYNYIMAIRRTVDEQFGFETQKWKVIAPQNPFRTGVMRRLRKMRRS